jgi:hypothetical protein
MRTSAKNIPYLEKASTKTKAAQYLLKPKYRREIGRERFIVDKAVEEVYRPVITVPRKRMKREAGANPAQSRCCDMGHVQYATGVTPGRRTRRGDPPTMEPEDLP